MNKISNVQIPWQITLSLALVLYFISKIMTGVVADALGAGGFIFLIIFLFQIVRKIKK